MVFIMRENSMRKKNMNMLLKLSLIVLFTTSTVQQSFASGQDDSSWFWRWGRNIFNCVKFGSAFTTVASGSTVLYYEKQKKNRTSELKNLSRVYGKFQNIFAEKKSLEEMGMYNISINNGCITWNSQNASYSEWLRPDMSRGEMDDSQLAYRHMSNGEMNDSQLAYRHFTEKFFLENRKLLEPWVNKLSSTQLQDKNGFEEKVNTLAFLVATDQVGGDIPQLDTADMEKLRDDLRVLDHKIGRFGKFALRSGAIFGLTVGLSGDRRTQIATSVVAPAVLVTAHLSPSMKAAIAVLDGSARSGHAAFPGWNGDEKDREEQRQVDPGFDSSDEEGTGRGHLGFPSESPEQIHELVPLSQVGMYPFATSAGRAFYRVPGGQEEATLSPRMHSDKQGRGTWRGGHGGHGGHGERWQQ